jgi:hypothetical protein
MTEESEAIGNGEDDTTQEIRRRTEYGGKTFAPGIRSLLAVLLLVNLAMSLYQLPLNRVVERRLCREYYMIEDPSVINRDGSVSEDLCKKDEIQQNLAWIQGAMETAWIVGGRSHAYILTGL